MIIRPDSLGGLAFVLRRRRVGDFTHVEIDHEWAWRRHVRRGDVVGFWHTHPWGPQSLSTRDHETMRANVLAYGRPLLCVVRSFGFYEKAWLYETTRRREVGEWRLIRWLGSVSFGALKLSIDWPSRSSRSVVSARSART